MDCRRYFCCKSAWEASRWRWLSNSEMFCLPWRFKSHCIIFSCLKESVIWSVMSSPYVGLCLTFSLPVHHNTKHHLETTTFSKTTLCTKHLFFFRRQAALKNFSRSSITRVVETCATLFTQEEPSLAEMADYDRVYYDDVTSASLSSKLFEEAIQLEIWYMKEMNVFSLFELGAVTEFIPRTRVIAHCFTRTTLVSQEMKKTTEDGFHGHVSDICCDPTCYKISILPSSMTGEKKRTHRMSCHSISSTFQGRIFIRRSAEKWRMQGDPSCPSGIAMLNRAMYISTMLLICIVNGRWRNWIATLECSICVCINILLRTSVYSDTSTVLRHLRHVFRSRNWRNSWAKHTFFNAHCNIASETTTPWMMWSTISESCATGLCRRLGKRQNVLKSKLSQVTQNCQSKKFRFAIKRIKEWHTTRASKNPFTHSQTLSRYGTSYRSNDSRTCQLIDLNCNFPVKNVEALKRCIRFLLKYRRCIQSFETRSIVPKQITCFSDSNFAGCWQSKKDTSSCQNFHGKHLLKSTSTTQAVVSLSSAEAAEFCCVPLSATTRSRKSKRKVKVMELFVPALISNWTQWQDEQMQCEEVLDASYISQPRRCGCNVSWSMATSRWLELGWLGHRTFGLPTLEVLWTAFCGRLEQDCTQTGILFDNDSNEQWDEWIATHHCSTAKAIS